MRDWTVALRSLTALRVSRTGWRRAARGGTEKWQKRTTAPQPTQAQRNGQSAISQDNPLRELHQEGDAQSDRPIGSALVSPELTDEEVSVLCDERDASTKSGKQPVVQSLIERGFIDFSEEPLARVKLTPLAQELLSKRGVGLNKS